MGTSLKFNCTLTWRAVSFSFWEVNFPFWPRPFFFGPIREFERFQQSTQFQFYVWSGERLSYNCRIIRDKKLFIKLCLCSYFFPEFLGPLFLHLISIFADADVRMFGSNLSRAVNLHQSGSNLQAISQE